jgi:hypothetical protein
MNKQTAIKTWKKNHTLVEGLQKIRMKHVNIFRADKREKLPKQLTATGKRHVIAHKTYELKIGRKHVFVRSDKIMPDTNENTKMHIESAADNHFLRAVGLEFVGVSDEEEGMKYLEGHGMLDKNGYKGNVRVFYETIIVRRKPRPRYKSRKPKRR